MAAFNLGTLLQGVTGAPIAGILNGTQPPEASVNAQAPEKVPVEDIVVDRPEPRTGMFGVKGTARDILGVLGDAFLTQAGAAPIYRPRREQEKQADALGSDFYENPLASVDRLQQAGYSKEAQDLYNKITEQEIARQKAARDDRSAKATEANTAELMTNRALGNVGALLGNVKDDASYQRVRPIALQYLKQRGLESYSAGLPDKYDPSVNRFGLQPYQANRIEQIGDDTESKIDNRAGQLSVSQGRLAETGRHNRASENIAQQNTNIAADRAETYKNTAGTKGGRRAPPASPPKGFVKVWTDANGQKWKSTFNGGVASNKANWKSEKVN